MGKIIKIDKMHLLFGKYKGHKCKECNRLICEIDWNRRRYHKCLNYGRSNAESTDWRLSYDACGMFNKEIDKPAIRINIPEPQKQLENQVSIFDYKEFVR